MKYILSVIILLFAISEGSVHKTFTINLDLPPNLRFLEVNVFYKPKILEFINELKESFLGKAGLFLLEKLSVGEMLKDWTSEERGEVEGLAEVLGGHLQFVYLGQVIGDIWCTIRNFFGFEKAYKPGCDNKTESYWPLDWCTSILANQPSGVINARNFDFMSRLNILQYRGKFTKGGKLLFEADMIGGLMGVLTGMKEGAFGITEDTRIPLVRWRYDLLPLLETLVRLQDSKYKTQAMLIRDTFTRATTYIEALDMLSNTNLVAYAYIILSGVNRGQGAILSRNPLGCAHTSYLGDERFIIVTNYDYWNNDHRGDSDPRRAEAIKQLDAIPGQLTGHDLFKVLSSEELFEDYCTLDTTIIDPQIGEFDSTFWWTD